MACQIWPTRLHISSALTNSSTLQTLNVSTNSWDFKHFKTLQNHHEYHWLFRSIITNTNKHKGIAQTTLWFIIRWITNTNIYTWHWRWDKGHQGEISNARAWFISVWFSKFHGFSMTFWWFFKDPWLSMTFPENFIFPGFPNHVGTLI